MIWYLDEVIRPLVLLLPKISSYYKTFKDNGAYTNKNNKLMSVGINNNKLLEKYKTIWLKIKDFKNIELDALPVYDDRCVKTKTRIYGDKIYGRCSRRWHRMWIFCSQFY